MLSADLNLSARLIKHEDYSWIAKWFEDETLNNELGPMGKDWVGFVVDNLDGAEVVITADGNPISLVGFVWKTEVYSFHTLSDFCVDPERRSEGLGLWCLNFAIAYLGIGRDNIVAWVSNDNFHALHFFKKIGWKTGFIEDGMTSFFR